MTIPNDLLDALMKDYKNPEDLIGETALLKQLTKQLLERAMQAEMTEHLGYEKNIAKEWTMPIRSWKLALNQFTIIFEGRMPTI